MALVEDTIFGHEDKVEKAIQRLKTFEPPEGYWLAFSGGKDSQCAYHLCKMAGVKFDAHYSVTSVDPPELMRFTKTHYPDVIWERQYWNDGKPEHYFPDGRPRPITMWNLIADHTIPPTRQARYCCSALKEVGGVGRVVVTGVRWAESNNRRALHGVADIQTESKKLHAQAQENPAYKMNKSGGIVFMDDNDGARQMVEQCYAKRKTTINPIVDWTDEDVWEFLNDVAKVPHCELYDEGFTRLGCICCPLSGRDNMLRDLERWPRYKELYIKAFDEMIRLHPGEIKVATGELAEPNGGGTCGESGLTGSTDSSQIIQVEREREESASTSGQGDKSTTCGCGASEQTPTNRLHTSSRQTDTQGRDDGRKMAELVALDAPRGEQGRAEPFETLDQPSTHTHTHTARRCPTRQTSRLSTTTGNGSGEHGTWSVGSPRANSSDVHDVLAMVVQEEPCGRRTKAYNPNPHVADYESGTALLNEWICEFK